jgi:hypothetical protein
MGDEDENGWKTRQGEFDARFRGVEELTLETLTRNTELLKVPLSPGKLLMGRDWWS